jgi:hypothetical protein
MLRSIQLFLNRLSLNPSCSISTSGDWQCPRVTTLYQAIDCPIGHYKVPESQFDQRCEIVGLPCPSEKGYSCYCKPCIKAFEVDVIAYDGTHETAAEAVLQKLKGCDKMSLCGTIEQTKEINFHVHDNLDRDNVTLTALMHLGQESKYLTVTLPPNEPHAYDFGFSHNRKGVAILEVAINGVQIPESPFRVEVIEKTCPGKRLVAVRRLSNDTELNSKC